MVQAVPKLLRIDADSHFFPQAEFDDLASALPGLGKQAVEMIQRDAMVFTNPGARAGGFKASAAGKKLTGGAPAVATGPVGHGLVADRAKLLPETGFDMQVLIPDGIYANPFGSPIARDAGPGLTHAICRAFNVATAKAEKEFPEQFIGTAIVPFADVQESCDEARYAVEELGLKIICINGNWQGKNYDETELFPFWKTVHDLGAVLYVHHNPFNCQVRDHVPSTYTIGWERMRRMHVSNYLGFAFEYMMGMASLTLGGVLEEFPNLKFVFFEAGGSWLPWVMYTLDRVYGVEPQCARCTEKPSDLIRKSCFVAVEPDEFCLPAAVSAIGAKNFVIGSDYPHPPSTYPTTAAGIETMEGLSEQDKLDILGGNIQRLLGIK